VTPPTTENAKAFEDFVNYVDLGAWLWLVHGNGYTSTDIVRLCLALKKTCENERYEHVRSADGLNTAPNVYLSSAKLGRVTPVCLGFQNRNREVLLYFLGKPKPRARPFPARKPLARRESFKRRSSPRRSVG